MPSQLPNRPSQPDASSLRKSISTDLASTTSSKAEPNFSWFTTLWRFSRPHTIIGTTLSVFSLYLMAIAIDADPGAAFTRSIAAAIGAWITCLCGNVYIVGLNQLYDTEIDRINKPHLPLASGMLSQSIGWRIVLGAGILAFVLAPMQSKALTFTVWMSLLIGTAYSLPPIRLKRFSIWASMCIFTVRGLIVNLGLFLHFQYILRQSNEITAPVWALTIFILVFTFAIAIFKDIPDLEGDRRFNITTFTVQLGAQTVFRLAQWVITLCYAGMIIASLFIPTINAGIILISHTCAIGAVWILGRRVDLNRRPTIARYYQTIWKLFFLEYLVVPVACLFASG